MFDCAILLGMLVGVGVWAYKGGYQEGSRRGYRGGRRRH